MKADEPNDPVGVLTSTQSIIRVMDILNCTSKGLILNEHTERSNYSVAHLLLQVSPSSPSRSSQVQKFLRNNQEEGRKTSLFDETMEESDEEEDDGGWDKEAAAVQQSSSAEQLECSGASAALTSDPTTAPPAGPGAPLKGPDCSMNGRHNGEQMFGFIQHRNKKAKEEPVPLPGHGI